jgi:hypothetical protein
MEPRRDFQFDPFSENASLPSNDKFDVDGIDWSNPQEFFAALGGGGPKCPSPTEVRQEVQLRVKSIFAAFDILGSILERHEATIQKRWTKKTRQQRLQVLLKCWPNMPASHRPDFEAFVRENPQQRERGTAYRSQFIWPYINQEDLGQTKLWPMLLNTRGRNPPCNFAAADSDAMHLGLVTKALDPIFLNQYTMILHGAETAENYGKLLAWDDHPDAFDWMHTRKQFLPGEGLLVLEAQQYLLEFLVKCCQELLQDIPTATLTGDDFPPQPEPHLKTDNDTLGFASLAIMAAEAPYRLPMRLDLRRIESLLEAKVSAAEDHLWALREDPSYFAQMVLEVREHRQEMLKDTDGRAHPASSKLRENVLWGRVIGSLLADAHISLEVFSELHQQARNLSVLQEKYESQLSVTRDLPEDYLVSLLRFQAFLKQAAKGPMNQLKIVVVASPPMRGFFVREPPPDVHSTKILIRSRTGIKKDKAEQRLIWLLRTLWEDGHALFLARLPFVVDELERLLQSEPKADALISSHVLQIIGDLSIIAQCLKQIDSYHPWAQTFEPAVIERGLNFVNEYKERSKLWDMMCRAFRTPHLDDAVKLGAPTSGRFTYPYDKKRSQENVEALRKAESNLDNFWQRVDKAMHAEAPNIGGTALHQLFKQPRVLQRTREWVEPAHKAKTAEPIGGADVDMLYRPFSTLFIGQPEISVRSPNQMILPKVKVKTRGLPLIPKSDDLGRAPVRPTTNGEDMQPTFAVDARALKVFRTLFFLPGMTSTPGALAWNDFLHAMVSTGFQAEKLYGSVWQFSPSTLDVEKSIHFHEPHPKGKLVFEIARRYGRRLNRAYGWHGSMFISK